MRQLHLFTSVYKAAQNQLCKHFVTTNQLTLVNILLLM